MFHKDTAQTLPSLSADDRRTGERHMFWQDHGVLRTFWTNFGEVAPGVYRSNYPSDGRLERYRDLGIKAVLTLRGKFKSHHYLLEADTCKRLGLDLYALALSARQAPAREMLQEVFKVFDEIDRPFLIHCKSGADRAGLVSALYLLDQGATVAEAKKQLSLRFIHLKFTKTGILDLLLETYEARLTSGPIGIRDWVAQEYDAEALQKNFKARRTLPV